ncbi:hypothetical protein HJFPF1_12740 [Paramyrothecium foliicola]|nr:hypothetical protein HJFPF1_12740 [Paramyrothecium foliicola]
MRIAENIELSKYESKLLAHVCAVMTSAITTMDNKPSSYATGSRSMQTASPVMDSGSLAIALTSMAASDARDNQIDSSLEAHPNSSVNLSE